MSLYIIKVPMFKYSKLSVVSLFRVNRDFEGTRETKSMVYGVRDLFEVDERPLY